MIDAGYLPEGLPVPVAEPDGLSKPFWEGLKQNRLMVQRCRACATWQWGPEWICHRCHSFDVAWVEVEGRGRLFSWTRVVHPVHGALKERGPYLIAVVELPHAGSIRMLGNLLGDPLRSPPFGASVKVEFEHHRMSSPDFSLAQWRLADEP